MSEENKTQTNTPATPVTPKPFIGRGAPVANGARRRIVRGEKGGNEGKPNERGGRPARGERPRSEYDQKMIDIRRVTRVVAGGRRMSFAVALVIGDRKGAIGLGTGKGADTAIAINKALKQAKKNLIKLHLTKDFSLPYEVSAKYNSSKISIRPNKNKGMVAGSSARDILVLSGIKNVTSKIHSGSKNKLSNARVTMKALSQVGKRAPVFSTATSDAYTA